MTFRTLISIDTELNDALALIERYFSITVDKSLIEKIINDAKDNQVAEKIYSIGTLDRGLRRAKVNIRGKVDEYEPETIWIDLDGLTDDEAKFFEEAMSTNRRP
jgi:hypothetical protein